MSDTGTKVVVTIVMSGMLLMGFLIGAMLCDLWHDDDYRNGFRDGQVGALSGTRIEYRLERQPDGSQVWMKGPATRPAR